MSYTKGSYKRHFWVVFDNEGNKLADFDVSAENAQLDPQTVIDNANLFVAAPELVEVLESLVEEIQYRGLAKNIKKDFSRMNYLAQADKALTKAKGGQA